MWETVRLGDVCTVRRGETITRKEAVEGAVPVVGGGTKPTYFHNQPNREANCITISGSGAYAGFVNRWDVPIFASDCSTVEPKDETQIAKFVYYFLISQQQFIYDNFRSGSAQPHVYAKDVANLDYPILSTVEQKRIVERLDKAFAEIDKVTRYLTSISHLVDTLRERAVAAEIEKYEHNNDATKKLLSEVCDLQNGYAFKSKDYVESSNTLNIRMSNIRPNGEFDVSHNEKFLPDSYAKEYSEFLLSEGDLIIAMTDMAGDPKILGVPTLVGKSQGKNLLLNQRVGRLCKFSRDVYVPFLSRFLMTLKSYYKSRGAGGLQVNISKKEILSGTIYLPPYEEQVKSVERIDKVLSNLSHFALAIDERLDSVWKLKAAILKQELTPSEAV